MKHSRVLVWIVAAAAVCAGTSRAPAGDGADGASGWVVSSAEGAVEVGRGATAPDLVDTGAGVASGDRVFLGFGAKLSLIAVDGDAKGRVVTVSGPAEGTIGELVGRASSGATANADAIGALRDATTDHLGAAEVSRGESTGPLRGVYPRGQVAAPCADFLFVPEVDDLGGGAFELRLYDADPSKPGTAPVARCAADGPQVDVSKAFPELVPSKKYWWVAAVRSDEGEDLMAGEPVAFVPVKSPAGMDAWPRGLETPEQRSSWHLLRAKSLVQAKLHLDAYREYLELAAAGGGGGAVDKECRNLEKKLGLDAAAVETLTGAAGRTEATNDELVLTDGRKLAGRVVSTSPEAVLFQMSGTRYRIAAGDVKDVRYGSGSGVAVSSAAPFVTATSKRYIVTTNAGKEYAKEAARNLDALFDVFTKQFGDALGAHNAKNLKARIFRDDVDFAAFLAKEYPDHAKGQGFYATKDSTLYLFRSFQDGKETTMQTLFHEGAHQLLYMRCNQNPNAVFTANYWISEALPCYLEGLEWRGNALVLERPPESRRQNFMRLAGEAKLLPVSEFMGLKQAGYSTAEHYDQGTAVFWYFMRRRDGKDAPRFLEFVKDVLSARVVVDSDRKLLGAPIAESAEGYSEWFTKTFGTSATAR